MEEDLKSLNLPWLNYHNAEREETNFISINGTISFIAITYYYI